MRQRSMPPGLENGDLVRQLVRYGLVGAGINLAIYFCYLLIVRFGATPKFAMSVVYIVGAVFGFLLNRSWTFNDDGSQVSAALRYFLAHLMGYFLNYLLLATLVDHFGFPHQWVQAGAILLVAGFLFLMFKYFVFRGDGAESRVR